MGAREGALPQTHLSQHVPPGAQAGDDGRTAGGEEAQGLPPEAVTRSASSWRVAQVRTRTLSEAQASPSCIMGTPTCAVFLGDQ